MRHFLRKLNLVYLSEFLKRWNLSPFYSFSHNLTAIDEGKLLFIQWMLRWTLSESIVYLFYDARISIVWSPRESIDFIWIMRISYFNYHSHFCINKMGYKLCRQPLNCTWTLYRMVQSLCIHEDIVLRNWNCFIWS